MKKMKFLGGKRLAILTVFIIFITILPGIFAFLKNVWAIESWEDAGLEGVALTLMVEDTWALINRQNRFEALNSENRMEPLREYRLTLPKPIKRPLPVRFPSCSPAEVVNDPEGLRHLRFNAYPFNIRIADVGDTQNLLRGQAHGATKTAFLNACISSTPFAKLCSEWFMEPRISEAEVIQRLIENDKLLREADMPCWPQSEVEPLITEAE